ncbi:aspartyl-tRNA(Asn)/glutamyl-tRNA(Gln) amidotransferase subunit A [Kaistia soli DSM 19436]|uniref:Aspartyl-tRNA(Asn)/glutamyl-tRNA(Gln) amidotransferase subunit A n=1 Tax=Kaistia soli DSM 19436 TaxID=1122133 RepID=A0A1M5HYL0_9HYPH|nr:AtzE family amidohydrolase [Kaistia soli]SHG20982.1 aspartyl-tRNA(Asn)/glutamyl-tRNA(Gln) amidotransferase subunit A [Kaistia soli DSM 19436]
MSAFDILFRPGHEIAADVRARRVSAREVTEAALDAIEALDGKLNAFTDVTAERAIEEANRVDAAVIGGTAPPLAGVPYAVKNLFDIEGVVTRAGSKINRENPPAAADASLVTRMQKAGAVLIGGVNMGEYAYDFTGENVHDGASLNPHDPARMSGGSSGGSGTAVASGMVALSLGSDTNGSIRVPSSFCGLYGLKPTFGRLSRARTFPFVASLDHLGPIARSPRDLAMAFDALQFPDPDDRHQLTRRSLDAERVLRTGIDGLRIAVAGDYFRSQAGNEALAAVDHVAKALGADREVDLPEVHRARAAAYVITTSESSALHLPRLQSRARDYDPDTRDRFLSGAMVPAAWYVAAQRFRSWFRAEMERLFETVDVILAPSTPFPALLSGTKEVELAGNRVPARPNIGIFAQPISFIGLPVVAVPVWPAGTHLPIGVQVIAPAWREDIALRVAEALHQAGTTAAPVAPIRLQGS